MFKAQREQILQRSIFRPFAVNVLDAWKDEKVRFCGTLASALSNVTIRVHVRSITKLIPSLLNASHIGSSIMENLADVALKLM